MSSAEPSAAGRGGMLVVDAQIHVWRNEDAQHPWKPEWRSYAHRGGISPAVEELIADGTADWLWRAAEAASVPVMAFTPERVGQLAPVAGRFPGLRLVIDHAGLPTYPPPMPMEELVEEAAELAWFPNVAVKASAFPCSTTEPFPFPTAQRCVRRLVEAFGAERVFWGTDLTRLPCSYSEAVAYLGEPGGLNRPELELVMGRGLVTWLGWDAN